MTTRPIGKDWICQDVPRKRTFAAFNCDRLTMELICDADIVPIRVAKDSVEASQAWSANCDWYFAVTAAGIILGRPGHEDAKLCMKKSWRFLEAFIEAR